MPSAGLASARAPPLRRAAARRAGGCQVSAAAHRAAAARPLDAPAGAGIALAAALGLATAAPALAGDASVVAEFNASGLFFKDSVQVEAIPDPKVDGAIVYLSDFKRSLTAKLAKDFFSEPSQASLSCVASGPITITGDLGGRDGEELFSERRNLNLLQNKTLRVRRIYDKENNVLLYVAYSTRTSSAEDSDAISAGRYKSSVCAVAVNPTGAAPPVAAEAPSP